MSRTQGSARVQNAANVAQVKNAGMSVKEREKQLDKDLRELLASPVFRRVAWRLLERFGVYRSTFALESNQMAFNAGEQNLGLWFLAWLTRVDQEAMFTMMREAQAAERREQRTADAVQADSGSARTEDGTDDDSRS